MLKYIDIVDDEECWELCSLSYSVDFVARVGRAVLGTVDCCIFLVRLDWDAALSWSCSV